MNMKNLPMPIAGKRACLFALAFFALVPLFLRGAEGSAEVFLLPETVTVNEPAYLVLRMRDRKPDIGNLPSVKNLRWIAHSVRTSSQVSIINGKMSSTYENHIPFVVTKKGEYVIPLEKLLNGASCAEKEIVFQADEPRMRSAEERNREDASGTARSRGREGIALEDAFFSDAVIPGKKKSFYVGEEIPLRIDLYILRGLSGRPLAYPQIKFGENNSAVFHDYGKRNQENSHFEPVATYLRKVGGRPYDCYVFRTKFTPIAPGEMKISSLLPALLVVPDDQGSARRRSGGFFDDDDFFGSFFSQSKRIERNLPASTLVTILPQPPLTEKEAFFTGLTGNWKGEVSLSPGPYKTGEPVNLKIRFTGSGSLDFLKAPRLTLENFRVYPPEVEKGSSFAEIRYVLIPTSQMEAKKDNVFLPPLAILDPETGKYRFVRFSRSISVEKGTRLIPREQASVVVEGKTPSSSAASSVPGEELKQEREHADDVLYLKKEAGSTLALPLWKNHLFSVLVLVISGILFLLIAQCVSLVKKARENDPFFARRKEGALLRKKLLHILSALPPEKFPEQGGSVAEVLADLSGLAPGADLAECAEKVEEEDPEFSRMLKKLADAAWMPGTGNALDETFKKSFLKKFSRIRFLLAAGLSSLLLAAGSFSAEAAEKKMSSHTCPPTNMAEAARAYDGGDFALAENYYRSRLKKGEYSGAVLYDLGNTLYRQGKYAEALCAYEKALRFSPRDPDVLENLNLVRRKLALPERGKVNTPGDVFPILRDQLRPDEWLLAASFGFFLLCLGLGAWILKKNFSSLLFRIPAAAGAIVLLCSLCAFFSQMNSSYSGKYGIVLHENIPVYSLPSNKSDRLSIRFRGGEEVCIQEKRQDFLRVRAGNAEGWVNASNVGKIFPRGENADKVE
ncbi:MAG: BatD family protein [Lentisphaeria bacterium]|nr:BatD family protein [Lentisphaeria bacterium]